MTIVGVMPPEMNYPAGNDLWTPLEIESNRASRTYARLARDRAASAWCYARAGASGRQHRLTAAQAAVWRRDLDVGRRSDAAARSTRRQRSQHAVRAARRVGVSAAHRLRQRREPARGAPDDSPRRDRTSAGTRRESRASRAAAPHRGRRAVARSAQLVASRSRRAVFDCCSRMQTGNLPRANEIHISWPVLAVRARRRDHDRRCARIAHRMAGHAGRHPRGALRIAAHAERHRLERQRSAHARRVADGADGRSARRCGAARSQLRAAARARSRAIRTQHAVVLTAELAL